MKKTRNKLIISLLLSLSMLVALLGAFSLTASAAAAEDISVTIDTGASITLRDTDGDGAYEIGNADELYAFAAAVNGGNTAINGELTANIVVNQNVLKDDGTLNGDGSNFRVWTLIGYYNSEAGRKTPYTGIFDGNGYTVSGLYFNNSEAKYVGLFGWLGGIDANKGNGTVQNVGVIDSYLSGKGEVGGLVGRNYYGTITNCYNTATVTCNNDFAGGVAGKDYGNITSCQNYGAVIGTAYVGGVVGDTAGIVANSYNTGTVTVTSTGGRVGGVAGRVSGGAVTNCYNTGSVSGTTNYVGGVVGNILSSGTVTNCYYVDTAATGGIKGADVTGSAEAKTIDQFNSGEVAYLLNGDQTTLVFGQQVGTDLAPVLKTEANTVYKNQTGGCTKETYTYEYSNISKTSVITHSFDNGKGFCPACGGNYQPATLNEDGYYEIGNAGQLYWFMEFVNANTLLSGGDTVDAEDDVYSSSANAILTDNIVVNENVLAEMAKETPNTADFRQWTPIGSYEYKYIGIFDGNNKVICGLYFNDSSVYDVGFIGDLGVDGKIQNVGIIDSYYNANEYVGGVVGWNEGSIQNCFNMSMIIGETDVGGVVGYNEGNVQNCYNMGTVVAEKKAGGISGTAENGYIINCYSIGEISGDTEIGGIVGRYHRNSSIINCYYLVDTAESGIGGTNTSVQADPKNQEAFASGEVAYLLGEAFGQEIGEDAYPVLGGTPVTDGFSIYGQQLNVGGDLSMKYYVIAFGDGVSTETLKMKFIFLGRETVVSGIYNAEMGMYVFTLEGITPQCMGDKIDAYLLLGDEEKASKLSYTVEENLLALRKEYEEDEALVTLVNDILAYGTAASEYKNHNSMTTDYVGSQREIPYTNADPLGWFEGYTVVFGHVNYIKVKVDLMDKYSLYLDGVDVTDKMVDGIFQTSGIAPSNFNKTFRFEIKSGSVTMSSLSISVNDYIYAQRNSGALGKLVKALYNYGESARYYSALVIDGTLGGKAEATEEDVRALVDQIKAYLDSGNTTIIVTGENPAMIDMGYYTNTAIGEAIYRLSGSDYYDENNPYNGKIDLILSDVTEIVYQEFYSAWALNSITLPKVTTIGGDAFFECWYLEKLTFGSVVTDITDSGEDVFKGIGHQIYGCELVLNRNQVAADADYQPNLETQTWCDTEWKSITLE